MRQGKYRVSTSLCKWYNLIAMNSILGTIMLLPPPFSMIFPKRRQDSETREHKPQFCPYDSHRSRSLSIEELTRASTSIRGCRGHMIPGHSTRLTQPRRKTYVAVLWNEERQVTVTTTRLDRERKAVRRQQGCLIGSSVQREMMAVGPMAITSSLFWIYDNGGLVKEWLISPMIRSSRLSNLGCLQSLTYVKMARIFFFFALLNYRKYIHAHCFSTTVYKTFFAHTTHG